MKSWVQASKLPCRQLTVMARGLIELKLFMELKMKAKEDVVSALKDLVVMQSTSYCEQIITAQCLFLRAEGMLYPQYLGDIACSRY